MTTQEKVIGSDIEISRAAKMDKINKIAEGLGISETYYEPYGHYKAKLSLDILEQSKNKKDGHLILVTSINPTSAGEGKSTVTIGLGQALHKINANTVIAIREPSLGPTMGLKGGACGGGYSQVVPMEDINLHFTGDFHAITTAHNALSAAIDNHIHHGNDLQIDTRKIIWKRVLDLNDRSLRNITIGQGGPINGFVREDGFDITVASEIMAIFCLALNYDDLKSRLGKMLIAYNLNNEPIYVSDLAVEGALTLLLKDALKPNLVQTLENTPAIVHGGPFANIAHGCNSLLGTKMALKLGEYVVTEAGFGADLGAEKFLNIKMPTGELKPSAVVIVATIRALKLHGGAKKDNLKEADVLALEKGIGNLAKHIETIKAFNLPFVVALNVFSSDSVAEIEFFEAWCKEQDVNYSFCDVWAKGGVGGESLAKKIIAICENETNNFTPLYTTDDSVALKLERVSKIVYGADGVNLSSLAQKQLLEIEKNGWNNLPICFAKTPFSLTDDPTVLGRPTGFTITISKFKVSLGAQFIVAYAGNVLTMPGLPKAPAMNQMDVDSSGNAIGLF